ncbi:unnamed protein product [Mytilus coruscus]|uniref:Tudor domain-containing protein n=1 Tax=Mytilus coruscus TaxID=42192 RepID=A0A6J8CCN1_MYTCO|nr:unnamed protein product [Mytilus coruscus]
MNTSEAEEEILAGLPLHRYKAVDKTFTTLENRKSRSNFLTDLQDTLDSLQLQFARIEEEIPAAKSKPTQKTKTKFVHKSLHEELRTQDQDVYEFDDTDLSLREQDMEVTIENEELDVIPDTPTGSQATSSRKRNKEGELLNILDRLRERAEKTQEDDQTEEIHVFTKGEKVSAYYSNDKKWYDAVITAVLKDGYRIKYVLDGFREVIKDTALLKKM